MIEKEDPQLIIIEAAAGFGKTCSAYELLNHLVTGRTSKNPLFTELSRNRGAKIFRYVLLDEIDLEYPSLNSELVKHEISTGRVPLIIDGFDELLTNANIPIEDEQRIFEEVESMLDTIGSLLTGKTKIILTTRRTTIFTGSNFNNWLIKWNSKFDTTVFSIREPKIKDWLGNEKYDSVKERNFPIQYIANPVLLSYLRNISIDDFVLLLEDQEGIVQNYFNFLLEREIERQNLNMNVSDQYLIFKNVAKILIELDCSSEEKEFFKQIIISENTSIINETRRLYSSVNRPSIDEMANTLSNHALLDRKGRNENFIGFINDFVFGTFIGELLIESLPSEISKYSLYMIELGVTAYMVSSKEKKELLWNKIIESNTKIDIISLFKFDITLRECLMRSYIDGVFENLSIYSIVFSGYKIGSSVYVNCTFRNCSFECSFLHDVSFVNCKFISCEVKGGGYLDRCDNIDIIKCSQTSCSVLIRNQTVYEEKEGFSDLEKDLLSKIFQISNESHSKSLIHLMTKYNKAEKRIVANKLEEFEHHGYIRIIGSNILLEINKIAWLKAQIK